MAVLEEVKQGILKSSVAVPVIAMQDKTRTFPVAWNPINTVLGRLSALVLMKI